jgi:hypothetical protein
MGRRNNTMNDCSKCDCSDCNEVNVPTARVFSFEARDGSVTVPLVRSCGLGNNGIAQRVRTVLAITSLLPKVFELTGIDIEFSKLLAKEADKFAQELVDIDDSIESYLLQIAAGSPLEKIFNKDPEVSKPLHMVTAAMYEILDQSKGILLSAIDPRIIAFIFRTLNGLDVLIGYSVTLENQEHADKLGIGDAFHEYRKKIEEVQTLEDIDRYLLENWKEHSKISYVMDDSYSEILEDQVDEFKVLVGQ